MFDRELGVFTTSVAQGPPPLPTHEVTVRQSAVAQSESAEDSLPGSIFTGAIGQRFYIVSNFSQMVKSGIGMVLPFVKPFFFDVLLDLGSYVRSK